MWGSSFADLAKKAQELQEQAEQAISQTATTSSFFNLDAIQEQQTQETSSQQTTKKKQHHAPPPAAPVRPFDPFQSHKPTTTVHHKSPVAKGKLQVKPTSPPEKRKGQLKMPTSPLRVPSSTSKRDETATATTKATAPVTSSPKQQTQQHTAVVDERQHEALIQPLVVADTKAASPREVKDDERTHQQKQQNGDDEGGGWDEEEDELNLTEDDAVGDNDQMTENAKHPQQTNNESASNEEHAAEANTAASGGHAKQPEAFTPPEEESPPVAVEDEPAVVESSSSEDPADDPPSNQNATEEISIQQNEDVSTEDKTEPHRTNEQPDNSVSVVPTAEQGEASGNASTAVAQEDKQLEKTPPNAISDDVISDNVLRQFSEQMKRVEENHLAERMEMERQHAQQIEALKASFSHEACEAARKEMEERLVTEIRQKEEQLHEVMRTNEGQKLKLDVLKREVTGTQALLEARDSDIGKVSEENSRNLTALEEKLQQSEQTVANERQLVKNVETLLEKTQGELAASKQEHADLKARVKGVAAELKERRTECRELHANVEQQQQVEQELRSKVEELEFHVSDRDKSRSETSEEMEQLKVNVIDSKNEMEKLKKEMSEQKSVHEKGLMEYKKKAQSSLALANSRTAAAVQAKEEAELEARAARSTADTAMERAVQAELSSRQALAEAKSRVTHMEAEKDRAVKEHEKISKQLKETASKLSEVQAAFDDITISKQEITAELETVRSDFSTEKVRTATLQRDLQELKKKQVVQHEELTQVREKLWHVEQNAHSKASEESENVSRLRQSTAEADHESVTILQEELQEANKAIEDLKQALMNAVEQNDEVPENGIDASESSHHERPQSSSNGSTPLFYAMEKQVELNAARSEINRLASMLSNVQSEKMEAYEMMEDMRKGMQDAEARLMRYEKLRHQPDITGHSSAGGDGGDKGSSAVASSKAVDSGAVNIEYLKNIMLSYLNAKTVAERKSLVPVIGAVLCLTPDEQSRAMHSVEEGKSIGDVGHSLFESFSDERSAACYCK